MEKGENSTIDTTMDTTLGTDSTESDSSIGLDTTFASATDSGELFRVNKLFL